MTNAIRRLISGGIAGIRDVVCDPKPEDSAGRMLERQDPSRRRKGKRAGIRSGAEHMGAPRPDRDRRRRSGASWRSARRISNSHPGLSGGGGVHDGGSLWGGALPGRGSYQSLLRSDEGGCPSCDGDRVLGGRSDHAPGSDRQGAHDGGGALGHGRDRNGSGPRLLGRRDSGDSHSRIVALRPQAIRKGIFVRLKRVSIAW